MREARELQTQIEQLERHIANLDKQLQDVVLAKPEMPTKIIGPNLEEILNAAGFYRGDAVCCNDYEKCIKPCTPKGRWLAEKELAHLEQVDYEKLTAKFGEQAKEYLVAAKKNWEPEANIVKWSIPVDPNNFGESIAQSEQTETLRVADAIELNVATNADRLFAANELRRLHEENETLKKCLFQMQNAAIELAKPEPVVSFADNEEGLWIHLECNGSYYSQNLSEGKAAKFFVNAYRRLK
jgi:hypothetical protein